jgi:4-amino-4-deoxy-L-arabinose transferase-like glycosyltransferase
MEELFSPHYQWLWTGLLGVALFFPVRQLIWVLSVRREESRLGQPTDDARRRSLKRRATVTSVLLCLVFSVAYIQVMFKSLNGTQ